MLHYISKMIAVSCRVWPLRGKQAMGGMHTYLSPSSLVSIIVSVPSSFDSKCGRYYYLPPQSAFVNSAMVPGMLLGVSTLPIRGHLNAWK
jgi:hypothetical protein